MTAEQFTYWLNGFIELNPNAMLTLTQWQIVKDHLALVFKKETPDRTVSPRQDQVAVPSERGQPFPHRVLVDGWPTVPATPWTPPQPFLNPQFNPSQPIC